MVCYNYINKQEFVNSVDRQLRAIAVALIGSNLADLKQTDLRKAEDIISQELGAAKSGKFFIIKDAAGNVIFKDKSVDLLDLPNIPSNPQWVTLDEDDQFIRVLNLSWPTGDHWTLQVGVSMSNELAAPQYSGNSIWQLGLVIVSFGVLASLILTIMLLRPLNHLGVFLASAREATDRKIYLPDVPHEIYAHENSNDEFFRLCTDLNKLIHKINDNYKMHQLWTTQMAHELKTPLSLISLRIENTFLNKTFSPDEKKQIEGDLVKISSIINAFLDWAEIEYSENKRETFAVRLSKVLASVKSLLTNEQRELLRVVQEGGEEATLLAHPQHVEQLLSNLIVNAYKYSDPGTEVVVTYTPTELTVSNQGKGFSPEVLKRLGQPFNKGDHSSKMGHGLGLAWIKSICKLNEWSFIIDQKDTVTVCRIIFGPNKT